MYNLFEAVDSGDVLAHPRITTAQNQTPDESLLQRLGLQMNHYCADN